MSNESINQARLALQILAAAMELARQLRATAAQGGELTAEEERAWDAEFDRIVNQAHWRPGERPSEP